MHARISSHMPSQSLQNGFLRSGIHPQQDEGWYRQGYPFGKRSLKSSSTNACGESIPRISNYRKSLTIGYHTCHFHHVFICIQHMGKKVISKNHAKRAGVAESNRIETDRCFHSLRKIYCISVCHVCAEAFFQSRTSSWGSGPAITRYCGFSAFTNGAMYVFLLAITGCMLSAPSFLKVSCNLLTGTRRCDLIDHGPWESNLLSLYHLHSS